MMGWTLSFHGQDFAAGKLIGGWSSTAGGNINSLKECLLQAKALYDTNGEKWENVKGECQNETPKKALPDWYQRGEGGDLNPDEFWEIIRFDRSMIDKLLADRR